MKRKTWMISALMYAMVFMACFGVLHFMKKVMEPPGPVQVAGTEPIEEPSDSPPWYPGRYGRACTGCHGL